MFYYFRLVKNLVDVLNGSTKLAKVPHQKSKY